MRLLEKLFKKKADTKAETKPETKVETKPETEFEKKGIYQRGRAIEAYDLGRKVVALFVDNIQLGWPCEYSNLNKSDKEFAEDIRQTVLMLQAQQVETETEFNQIKQRALHQKSLLGKPEFEDLVLRAFHKARETGLEYTDPAYQQVFTDVMKESESMTIDVHQKVADVMNKKANQKEGVKEETEQVKQNTTHSRNNTAFVKDVGVSR